MPPGRNNNTMTKTFLEIFLGLILSLHLINAQNGSPVSFEKQVIYSEFISEGANVADMDQDGDLDILAGHYWFEAPDWQTHEIRTPEKFDYTKGYSHSFLDFTMDVNQDFLFEEIQRQAVGLPIGEIDVDGERVGLIPTRRDPVGWRAFRVSARQRKRTETNEDG